MKKVQSYLIAPIIAGLSICVAYFPDVVFYFDRIEGEARFMSIDHNYFSLEYYHSVKKDTISLSGSVKDQRKLNKYLIGRAVPVEYSQRYPNRIYIKSVTPKSWIGGVVLFVIGLVCVISCAAKLYS